MPQSSVDPRRACLQTILFTCGNNERREAIFGALARSTTAPSELAKCFDGVFVSDHPV